MHPGPWASVPESPAVAAITLGAHRNRNPATAFFNEEAVTDDQRHSETGGAAVLNTSERVLKGLLFLQVLAQVRVRFCTAQFFDFHRESYRTVDYSTNAYSTSSFCPDFLRYPHRTQQLHWSLYLTKLYGKLFCLILVSYFFSFFFFMTYIEEHAGATVRTTAQRAFSTVHARISGTTWRGHDDID